MNADGSSCRPLMCQDLTLLDSRLGLFQVGSIPDNKMHRFPHFHRKQYISPLEFRSYTRRKCAPSLLDSQMNRTRDTFHHTSCKLFLQQFRVVSYTKRDRCDALLPFPIPFCDQWKDRTQTKESNSLGDLELNKLWEWECIDWNFNFHLNIPMW